MTKPTAKDWVEKCVSLSKPARDVLRLILIKQHGASYANKMMDAIEELIALRHKTRAM